MLYELDAASTGLVQATSFQYVQDSHATDIYDYMPYIPALLRCIDGCLKYIHARLYRPCLTDPSFVPNCNTYKCTEKGEKHPLRPEYNYVAPS